MSSLSPDDFRILIDPETLRLVEEHLGEDPARLAFRLKCGREQARLVCQQVKYLGRAANKLPSYYAARCIIPPLSYEQCSSEAAAAVKPGAGALCIDLTCGLGVDSFSFSKSFGKVIAIERDAVLADVARHNFSRLGTSSIEVLNTTAEAFLSDYSGPPADLIYVDPARRSENERVFLLNDCSPDVTEMLPLLLNKSKRVLIKLSPLFDIGEALRVFDPYVSKLEIVSVGGEVKELLAELATKPGETKISVRPGGNNAFSFVPEDIFPNEETTGPDLPDPAFLLIPDAAFYKGRLVRALFRRYYPEAQIAVPDENGFAFASEAPKDFPGRIYLIVERMDYQPKRLKKTLKDRKTGRINILRRNFPYKSQRIKQELGIQEGGTEWLAFTEIDRKPLVFRVEPVNNG